MSFSDELDHSESMDFPALLHALYDSVLDEPIPERLTALFAESALFSEGGPSMPEMAHAGEDHGDAGGIGGGDDFLVTDRAARLDDGGGAGGNRRL